ncbi:uncharacterized protein [Nicotiana tomentosiformis]|uniref:uncharacterized protein n=1 Tax=Nicotiana tomentosiformis TaxID=4098 RepID=UPI00051ADB0A|nr:uncharacterized protein LOC104084721 [Nicotiana tomentosiformis]
MNLSYVEPVIIDGERVAQLQKKKIEQETLKWEKAAILYVVGDSPTICVLERFIAATWNFTSKPKMYYHNEGYFVVLFNSLEDRDAIIFSGTYTINNRPIIVRAWSPEFNFSEEVLRTISLWIRLPNLPLNYWDTVTLSRIGSVLGCPIYAGECTSGIDKISYARILVEMDVTRELPVSIKVQDLEGKFFEQAVEYDWKPIYCPECLQIGHTCRIGPEAKHKTNGNKGKQTKPKMIKAIWQKTQKQDSVSMEQIQPKEKVKKKDGKQSVVVDSTAAITNTNNNIEKIGKEDDWQKVRGNAIARTSIPCKMDVVGVTNIFSPLMGEANKEMHNSIGAIDIAQSSRGGTRNSQLKILSR